ncbi:helix-hairpin-helix domain-containing protein [Desulfuromonas sp. AOP6]|uniref:ComEA family DNA-binding protein n=1 Tax=Desulfuromonas sp. AOP6 TaxID=1566351 RepID=UPI0012757D96|nr:helix-hairpin-helix domain-containing protein [Desulfuromonas sp. AOP6]BCA80422.1 hypothetical protein AOP6_2209 [Desulfuromonas sp. AOP6]
MRNVFVVCVMVLSLFLVVSPGYSKPLQGGDAAAVVAVVNINQATVTELQRLPDIGQVTAERIVAYRTEKGPFRSSSDLVKVKGIGQKKLEKLKDYIVVE